MVTGCLHTRDAIPADMAMRWSFQLCTVPPVSPPPVIFSQSSPEVTAVQPREVSISVTEAIRSLSFSRSLPIFRMRVSPSAAAAATDRIGTRSGICAPSISQPWRWPPEMVSRPFSRSTQAPIRSRIGTMAESPCTLSGESPVTVSPSSDSAPAVSQKAPLDQSPSAVTLPGVVYRVGVMR